MIKGYFTLPKYRIAIFCVFTLPVLYFISRHNYNLFHSLADGVSIVIAACVFTIIWNSRRIVDNDYFLSVGIAFLFFAFLDLMHLLGNKNMGVFPEYGNLGPALYIASRYILSISLMIAPLFINRKLNTTLMFAIYSLVTLFILLSIFYWHIFPVCIIEGVGLTPFKVVSDYIIGMILLGAVNLLLINRRSFDSRVLWLIVSSIILSIATGLAFTLYADPFGIMNAIGHFLQIASFYLVFLAFIETSLTKPQDILYRKLKQSEEKLAENVKQLDDANVELKKEIAERKQTEEALGKSDARFQSFMQNFPGLAYMKDGDGRVVFANEGFSHYLGLNPATMLGKTNYDLFPAEFAEEITRDDRQIIESGRNKTVEEDFSGRHWVTYKFPLLQLGALPLLGGLTIDITDRKRIAKELQDSENRYRELSIIDDLTQLYNSRHFYHQLKMEIDRACRYGHPLTLLLLDLDDFKAFNDAYGHVEGDHVLLRLGQVVKRCLRQTDTAYRYGGEEFTTLLPMTTSADAAVTAERIRTEFKKETFSPVPGQDVHVTVSIGLAQYKPQEEMKIFVHRVDQLMYQGKKNGKDRVCFEP